MGNRLLSMYTSWRIAACNLIRPLALLVGVGSGYIMHVIKYKLLTFYSQTLLNSDLKFTDIVIKLTNFQQIAKCKTKKN